MQKKERSWLNCCICCKVEEKIIKGEMQIPTNPIKYEETYESNVSPSIRIFDRNSNQSKLSSTTILQNSESNIFPSTREDTPHSFSQTISSERRQQNEFDEDGYLAANRVGKHGTQSLKNQAQVMIASILNRSIIDIEKPQLTLEIVESKEMEEKEAIVIIPNGCINSKRNAKDGVTIFGTQNVEIQSEKEIINIKTCDIVVPKSESGFGLKHFVIYFDTGNKNFIESITVRNQQLLYGRFISRFRNFCFGKRTFKSQRKFHSVFWKFACYI